ncbi:histidine-type phosphatase [Dyella telluris]|uniref:Histidine-type phosphatase n=1 Tax=Dyella telluris TaxID=2763498 RepID=A0A7G8Q5Z9_9GAMM|nr:histidine-type phosphatase [Dyella telluris]QNK02207.1 histidine-type phosphatase [Dyella telluris]
MSAARLVALALACLLSLPAAASDNTPLARVIVLRHGVRSPTSAPAELAPTAAKAWHAWPVAPGVLTEHGAAAMQSLGQRYRQMLMADGLWSGRCDEQGRVSILADSTPRNRASGAALAKGLGGNCHLTYRALPAEQSNPLFHYAEAHGAKDGDAPTVTPQAWPPVALTELQSILLGCEDKACVDNARQQGRKLLLDPAHDDAASRSKAIKSAGSLSENLMLEYVQGFPAAEVAWGHGNEATIGRLISLHNLQFALAKKPLPNAAPAGSNLLAHIMATLQQAAGVPPEVQPLASRQTPTVLLVAHDTNLANLAGLLDVDWHDARQPDDYPPGGALVFDLVRVHGEDVVRLSSWMPTLNGLRNARLEPADAMVIRTLRLPPCPDTDACPLTRVQPWLQSRMASDATDHDIPVMPVVLP